MKRVLALAFLVLSSPAFSQPAIPDTPAGRAAALWLQIMDGDLSLIERYNTAYHRNMERNEVETFRALNGGGYRLDAVELNEPNKIVIALVERDTGDRVRRTFALDPADPTRALDFGSLKLPLTQRLSQPAALTALAQRGDQLVASDFFSGGVLVAQDGKTLMEKVWGKSDRAEGKPITPNTRFRMGSMNKMFTAVAALQLVSQGKLSLHGTVGQYLPDYPNKDIAAKVTIRHLLNHSGGTGDFFGPEFDKHRLTLLKNNEDYVAFFGSRAPAFEPGSEERYSNYGFILLGHIVQKVSGEDYYVYIDRHIFTPAGMTDSGSLPESMAVPNRSRGYTRKDGKWISNADTLPWRASAAGGGYSTLRDMLKFALALESGKLLPKPLLEQANSSQTKGSWYGFGFGIKGEGEARWYGHGGGAPGMNGDLRIYPKLGRVVVAFSNFDPATAGSMMEYYERRMPLN
ncbi:MAG: serine hydrolase domain-containing protein [Pseudomonadota bacterium]